MFWCLSRTSPIQFVFSSCRRFRLTVPFNARVKPVRSTSSVRAPHPVPSQSPFPILLRCTLFTGVTVTGVCVGSVILEYERWRSKALRLRADSVAPALPSFLHRVRLKCESLLGRPLSAADIYWVIVALNVIVFVGHRSSLGPVFARYFMNSPYGAAPALSMLLSVFSHHNLAHLAINMYVLHSFSSTLISMIGPGEFVSLFVGGGVFASFMSTFSKLARRSSIPSLGASGGICAVLGAFCLLRPESRLCVPFVVDVFPHSFPAHTACWVILGMEFFAAMFLAGRSPIDHAAHLGGLLFGMYYSLGGTNAIWRRRSAIVSKWTEFRGGR